MVPAAPGNEFIVIACVFVLEHPVAVMVSVTESVPPVALLAKLMVMAFPVVELRVALDPS